MHCVWIARIVKLQQLARVDFYSLLLDATLTSPADLLKMTGSAKAMTAETGSQGTGDLCELTL